jgi:hypothetical protein
MLTRADFIRTTSRRHQRHELLFQEILAVSRVTTGWGSA